jgi:hypothetical protein
LRSKSFESQDVLRQKIGMVVCVSRISPPKKRGGRGAEKRRDKSRGGTERERERGR